MGFDYDTVKSLERQEELRHPKGTEPARPPNVGGPAKREVVRDFTCPACGQVLEEAVAINGKVRGWCGIKHEYVVSSRNPQ